MLSPLALGHPVVVANGADASRNRVGGSSSRPSQTVAASMAFTAPDEWGGMPHPAFDSLDEPSHARKAVEKRQKAMQIL